MSAGRAERGEAGATGGRGYGRPGLEDEVVEDQADDDDVDQGANENDDVGGGDFAAFHGLRTLRENGRNVNVN